MTATDVAAPTPREHGIGVLVLLGCLAAAAVIFVIITAGMWAVTGHLGESAVLAAFCAVWGGPGFGVIAGGVMKAVQQERAAGVG